MHKRKTLLLAVLIVAAVPTGIGLFSATDHSTSNGWQSCANAPNAANGELPAPGTALEKASEGVTTARSVACSESS